MHNKRLILICLIAALAVAIAATVLLVVLSRSGWSGSGPTTNDVYYYEDDAPHADPEIVGMATATIGVRNGTRLTMCSKRTSATTAMAGSAGAKRART